MIGRAMCKEPANPATLEHFRDWAIDLYMDFASQVDVSGLSDTPDREEYFRNK